jgi:hypothetical protein
MKHRFISFEYIILYICREQEELEMQVQLLFSINFNINKPNACQLHVTRILFLKINFCNEKERNKTTKKILD